MKNIITLSFRNFNLNLNKIFLALYLIFICSSFSFIKAESVCDHELLILELKQDLEDNGILDCLRYSLIFNQESD